MHDFPIIIFAALLTFCFGLFSRLSERSPITAPMVFVAVGVIVSPFGFDALKAGINAPLVRIIAEVTLVLVLFVDASTINLPELLRGRGIPFRLLFIGLPLTMLLGVLLAELIFNQMNIWMIALMAFILSPTDAALGQAVVTSPVVPENIKQTINVESGLNDGIALPPILVCIAALSATAAEQTGTQYWIGFTMKQFLFGPLLGGLVGSLGGALVDRASRSAG
jgi:NhaP-type Na+/H+ or K+/H+ antiporter